MPTPAENEQLVAEIKELLENEQKWAAGQVNQTLPLTRADVGRIEQALGRIEHQLAGLAWLHLDPDPED